QYGLILAAAVISIVVNPWMFRLIPTVEKFLQRIPFLWRRMENGGPTPAPDSKGMHDHVVIVGFGRVGQHVGRVLEQLNFPYLVVDQDVEKVTRIQGEGIHTLFGDAANSEVLNH